MLLLNEDSFHFITINLVNFKIKEEIYFKINYFFIWFNKIKNDNNNCVCYFGCMKRKVNIITRKFMIDNFVDELS